MLKTRFGIEVELTGITRKQAAKTAAAFLGGGLNPAEIITIPKRLLHRMDGYGNS